MQFLLLILHYHYPKSGLKKYQTISESASISCEAVLCRAFKNEMLSQKKSRF